MKEKLIILSAFFLGIGFWGPGAFAAEGNSKASGVDESNFRCEKVTGGKLAEFKKKLVENCDLHQPYSASLSAAVGETYLYCCHAK